ncbi:LysR family transcriptional regulator [Pseudoalteromonas denitrificans]|uniref:DNA-binding transcriptional regulator, LysR family n=1 Tax=Pseudoalteromonas denitrificans DSM 6059 TaxID=1123010 RepID=A0A1I1GFD4_9GAMM|nr:LysR family transcriptional regulator [Pseudoalteromonas denitrificans]SFC07870.1 DNA-binding transcriptional regulator, LysR family [Pseudoalteromonas denitrificans DSM 6059]
MNIRNIDLNLLVYLNVLIEERSVSKAANKVALTQPAMSNALSRLRTLFDDPLLVRTAQGMSPTEKAKKIKPEIVLFLSMAEQITQPDKAFSPQQSKVTFRIMTNDYIEATLIAPFIASILKTSPHINFDILTPGDIDLQDMEKGLIDLAINRFTFLPKSFHQAKIWRDNFCCLTHKNNSYAKKTDLDTYLNTDHIWINRSGWGAETAVTNKSGSQKLGWVDEALWQNDKTRNIRVFTRHYMMTQLLLAQSELIATIPRRQAMLYKNDPNLVTLKVPFQIVPVEIKMIWSPLLHHSKAHQWLRRALGDYAKTVQDR